MTAAFVTATSVAHAIAALDADPSATLVAGATDLLPSARARGTALGTSWVALHAIAELTRIEPTADGGLRIGAAATHAAIAASASVRSHAAAVAQASAMVGSPATRTVATLGGNLANGSPAMDLGSPLLVHEARVELAGPAGRRTLALAELLLGPGRTALSAGELITAILLPAAPAATTSAYVRLGTRAAMEVATVGAAVALTCDETGAVRRARIALTAVAPTCVRVPDAEAALVGHPPTDAATAVAADLAAARCAPIDDARAPARYRRALVAVAVRRALAEARP